MIVDQPWMLDQVANEERLGMTFEKLFSNEINLTLPGYLKQIYRFFGLWVLVIGLFVCGFSRKNITSNSEIRVLLLTCIGIMCYSGLALAIFWIPSSPFIYLGCTMVILHVISFYAHIKYK
jgi:CHASE2 domain-containing sensor protein